MLVVLDTNIIISGTLRLLDELQDKIKEEAKRSKMSINQYILYTMTRVHAPSREEALRLLETIVPDVPPLPEDKMLPANV